MADIPGWIWILIGGIITFSSARLGERFTLFFWIGLLFVAYGFYKALPAYIGRKKETLAEHHRAHHQPHTAQKQHAIHYLNCTKCRNLVRSVDFFCWRCGNKLR